MKKKFNREHLKKAVILGLCLGCTIKTGYAADFIAQDGGTKEYTFTMDDRISVSAPYTPAIQLKNGANATLHFLEGAIEKDQFYISSPYAGIVIAEGG